MQSIEKFNVYDMDKTRINENHIYSVSKYYGFIAGLTFEKAKEIRDMMKSKTLRYSRGKIIPSSFRSFINNVQGDEVEESLALIAHHFWLDGNMLKIRNTKSRSREEIDEILFCADNIMSHPLMMGENLSSKFQLPLDTKINSEFFVHAEWVKDERKFGDDRNFGDFQISYGQMLPVLNKKVIRGGDFINTHPY